MDLASLTNLHRGGEGARLLGVDGGDAADEVGEEDSMSFVSLVLMVNQCMTRGMINTKASTYAISTNVKSMIHCLEFILTF
jgi:hypothetical protein